MFSPVVSNLQHLNIGYIHNYFRRRKEEVEKEVEEKVEMKRNEVKDEENERQKEKKQMAIEIKLKIEIRIINEKRKKEMVNWQIHWR